MLTFVGPDLKVVTYMQHIVIIMQHTHPLEDLGIFELVHTNTAISNAGRSVYLHPLDDHIKFKNNVAHNAYHGICHHLCKILSPFVLSYC